MFVPAPYLSTNGTAYWADQGTASEGTGNTPAEAEGNLGSWSTTYSSWSGIRVRQNMQKGVVGWKKYVNTPYHSLAVNYSAKEGQCIYQSTKPSWPWIPAYKALRIKPWNRSHGGAGQGGVGLPHDRVILDVTNSAALTHHNVYNRCIAEALLKLRNQRFDLSESLVGLKQTVGMVALRVARVIKAILAIRRGNVGQLREALGLRRLNRTQEKRVTPAEVSRLWLEYQFGFRPLLNDIYAGIELVNSGLQAPDSVATVTRRISQAIGAPGPFHDSRCTTTDYSFKGRSMAETKIVYRVDDPTLHTLTQLGIENPLYVAWVAMPFSFVVDWIAPVADWLQALSAPLGLTFVSSYTTRKVVASETCRFYETEPFPYRHFDGQGWAMGYDLCQIKRTVHNSWPGFLPYLTSPFTSTVRATNALALAVGLSPRR